MDFLPTDEQNAFVSATADFLNKQVPKPLAELAESGTPPNLIAAGGELGWFGLGVAADDGGIGGSVVDELLLFRELGRSLAPGPLLGTLLAARVAVAAGDAALASALINGERAAALALSGSTDAPVTVFDHEPADLVLVVGDERAELFAKPDRLDETECIDELTSMARCSLAGPALASAPAEPIRDLGWVLLSAQLAGIAEATRDATVSHLLTREQFGVLLGTFQGLKHRAADMAVNAEAAFALTSYAGLALSEDEPHARFYVMSARAFSSQAAVDNSSANIHLHGAMGITFEHDAHFYLKRAHVLNRLLGGPRQPLRELIAEGSPLT